MTLLDEIQQTVQQVAERVGPSVVGLGRGWARGSGVIVAPNRVLTAAHALRGDDVTVTLGDTTATGRVAGSDADLDVAIVEVETGEVPAIAWEPEAAGGLAIGAPVLALANPGGHGLRVTFGLVSATGRSFRGPRGRRIPGSIEHTAPLPRGSSGGPLVDPQGRLLGINAVRREGGLILAVPADATLRSRVDALARGETTARPRLGVALAHPRAARKMRAAVGLEPRDGLLVRGVLDDSPAASAGLQRGDLLIAAGNTPLGSADDLFDAIDAAGDTLTLRVLRGTDERDVAVRFSS
ncbi:MAG TPA: S1C family serine protease [Solirubrobacter sp.]|nr:S1C family serine protease [Solirubrobacter sp.]